MKRVVLNPKRDYSVVHHHPWVFSGAIRAVEGDPAPGETVAVESARGERLGWGSWSPASQIRVRMLSFDSDHEPDDAYVEGLVAEASWPPPWRAAPRSGWTASRTRSVS